MFPTDLKTGLAVELRAWIEKDFAPLYLLRSELKQEGEVKVSAEAKFMKSEAFS